MWLWLMKITNQYHYTNKMMSIGQSWAMWHCKWRHLATKLVTKGSSSIKKKTIDKVKVIKRPMQFSKYLMWPVATLMTQPHKRWPFSLEFVMFQSYFNFVSVCQIYWSYELTEYQLITWHNSFSKSNPITPLTRFTDINKHVTQL